MELRKETRRGKNGGMIGEGIHGVLGGGTLGMICGSSSNSSSALSSLGGTDLEG